MTPVFLYLFQWVLIHSADPQSRPIGIIVFTHVVRTSVRPNFTKSSITKQSENNVRYWRDCGSGRVDHWWHLFCKNMIKSHKFVNVSGAFLVMNIKKPKISKFCSLKNWNHSKSLQKDVFKFCFSLNWPTLLALLAKRVWRKTNLEKQQRDVKNLLTHKAMPWIGRWSIVLHMLSVLVLTKVCPLSFVNVHT